MNSTRTILVSALAALGLAAGAAQAQHHGGGGGGGGHGGFSGHVSSGHYSGGHYGGGHYAHGGYYGGHYHYGGYWPYWGFYLGVPLYWGYPYYGYPYYGYPYSSGYGPSYYAPPGDSGGMVYPEGQMDAPTTQVQPGPGAPTQEPAYRNYCESAKAYYPKVTSCPEGWRFEPQPVR